MGVSLLFTKDIVADLNANFMLYFLKFPNHILYWISSAKRAAYRWSRDRAKIASRWTWLIAQISDLEYRIRQHQELYILLKKSNGEFIWKWKKKNSEKKLDFAIELKKNLILIDFHVSGQVTFEDGEPVASNSASTETTQQASVNGYRGLLPGIRLGDLDDVTSKLYGNNTDDVELNGSARTRAFKASAFKKRKLLQSTNLHKISRRAARPW